MRLIFFSTILLLILSSCQSNETPEETADNADNNTDETTAESAGEDTDNVASEETTTDEQPAINESSEESTEESTNSRNEEERSADESSEDVQNQDATYFDIHSDEVQQALFSSSSVEEENLTFSQDVITEGMSQSEIEAQYGSYDFVYPGHGRPVVIYGNLGVVYSESFPYGTDDEHANEEINPNENTVVDVLFYAGLPYDEVVDALGEPDVDVYETEGGPVEGLQVMEYEIEDQENSTITGTFRLHDNESGEKMVDLMTVDEVPDDADEYAAQQPEESEDIDSEEEERIELFINGYIDALMGYYNNDDEAVLGYTRERSPNHEKISSNRASGNYQNHATHELDIIDITNVEGNEYEVTVSREYSHQTSDGRSTTEVEYSIVETPQGFMVYDFEELSNDAND